METVCVTAVKGNKIDVDYMTGHTETYITVCNKADGRCGSADARACKKCSASAKCGLKMTPPITCEAGAAGLPHLTSLQFSQPLGHCSLITCQTRMPARLLAHECPAVNIALAMPHSSQHIVEQQSRSCSPGMLAKTPPLPLLLPPRQLLLPLPIAATTATNTNSDFHVYL